MGRPYLFDGAPQKCILTWFLLCISKISEICFVIHYISYVCVCIRITFRDVFFLQQTGYLSQNNGKPQQGIADSQAIIVENAFIIMIITIYFIIMIITICISVQ